MKRVRKLIGTMMIAAVISSTTIATAGPVKYGPDFSVITVTRKTVVEGQAQSDNRSKNSSNHFSRACATTNSFTGTLAGTAEIKAFVKKISVSLSLSYGRSSTITTTHTWDIDPKTNYMCQWGHNQEDVSGTMYQYSDGKIVSKRNAKGSHTKCDWFGGYVIR